MQSEATGQSRRGRRGIGDGRLLLVTSADIGRLDLVLRAAVRRLAGLRIVLAEPLVTSALPAGSGRIIPRAELAALDAAGDLIMTWQDEARTLAHTQHVIDLLMAGTCVVLAAPAGRAIERSARDVWPDVHVLRLEPGTQSLRAGLSRIPEDSTAGNGIAQRLAASFDARLRDHGDLSAVVRALSATLAALVPPNRSRERNNARAATLHADRVPRPRHVEDMPRLRAAGAMPSAGRPAKPQARVVWPT